MKLLLAAAAGAAMLTAAGAASAQALPSAFSPANVYINVGYSTAELESPQDLDVAGVTGKVGVRLGRHLGLEGEFTGGLDDELERQAGIYVVGFAPVTDNADVFARIGYGRLDIESPFQGGEGDGFDSINYGLGAQVFASAMPALGVRAEYTRIDQYKSTGTRAPARDANMFTVGIVYRLGR